MGFACAADFNNGVDTWSYTLKRGIASVLTNQAVPTRDGNSGICSFAIDATAIGGITATADRVGKFTLTLVSRMQWLACAWGTSRRAAGWLGPPSGALRAGMRRHNRRRLML